MHSGAWRLGHRPALDGLRGVAILLVLIGHSGPVVLQPVAWVGVTVFFGLSGFLITALLLEERATKGRIRLGAFWVRRARRLLPALLVMVAVTGALLVGSGVSVEPLPVFGYYANWSQAAGDNLGIWRHTWSLAIEEQFYLVWPLLLSLLPTKRAVTIACAVGIAVSLGLSATLHADFDRVYYGTDTRAWALLAGCLIAARLVGSARQTRRSSWLCASSLRWFGRRSYGIYLWHYPLTLLIDPLAGIALSLILAELSWQYVEEPLLGGLVRAVDREVVASGPSERGRAANRATTTRQGSIGDVV